MLDIKLLILTLLTALSLSLAVELTFELPDNAKQCFHEDIPEGTKTTIEYQVVTGGHYDVDCTLQSPSGTDLYKGIKKQYDTYTWTTTQSGTYTVCFSNEFSTFSHKLVYFDMQVGEEKPLPGTGDQQTAMTKMETASVNIHENLNTIIDYQTHHRLRESQSRKNAEDLNSRVLYWSIAESVIILFVTVGQVMVLKNFFSEKKAVGT